MIDRPPSPPPPPAAWFPPRRFGYGAGLPVRWQGWVALVLYLLMLLASLALPGWGKAIAAVTVTLAFLIVCRRTTRGGWRWRWGEAD